jgi:CheY-like chemotaxis protein
VILAEDHTLVREGTRRILEATNTITVVAEAADGLQAVEVVDRYEPDVAIIDIAMPGINGIEATRSIKQNHSRVGVLVLSMHDDEEFIFAVLEAGAARTSMAASSSTQSKPSTPASRYSTPPSRTRSSPDSPPTPGGTGHRPPRSRSPSERPKCSGSPPAGWPTSRSARPSTSASGPCRRT